MKKFLLGIVVTLAALSATAQELVPAPSVEAAKKQAETKCTQGCLVLSPAEIAAIEQNIEQALKRAFLEGRKFERSSI